MLSDSSSSRYFNTDYYNTSAYKYRRATSIPYVYNANTAYGGLPSSASNADSDYTSSQKPTGAYQAAGWSSNNSGYYRIATSIPYTDASHYGWINASAANTDADDIYTNVTGHYDGSGSGTGGGYRIATSIPYINSSHQAGHSATAVNADSDIATGNETVEFKLYGGVSGEHYRIATSIPYIVSGARVSFPIETAANADSDISSNNGTTISQNAAQSAETYYHRIATSIPYFTNQYMGIPTSTASNADSDNSTANTLTSWSMVETAGQYTKNPSYRIATSIPYLRPNSQTTGISTEAVAFNADSDNVVNTINRAYFEGTQNIADWYRIATSIPYEEVSREARYWGNAQIFTSSADSDVSYTASKVNRFYGGWGMAEDGTGYYHIATSIPYTGNVDPATLSRNMPSASNTDADTKYTPGDTYRTDGTSGQGYYRIATSIPYEETAATATRRTGFATSISNADISSPYTTRNFRDYSYAGTNQNENYPYRIATSIPYPAFNQASQAYSLIAALSADSDMDKTVSRYSSPEYYNRDGTGYYRIATALTHL